ncbi:MAG: MFS transporter, partial [Alphaproteobacteria bacterium]|nr:MFS transporter [Alphaproteobacteria bacterium]
CVAIVPGYRALFAGGLLVLAMTLLIAAHVSGIASAVIYALAFGVANAVSMTYYTFMWPRYFGRTHLGSIQGTGQMIGVVGASLGPLPLGFAKDYFGNYDAMLLGLAAIPLIWAVVAALFLRQPVKLKTL